MGAVKVGGINTGGDGGAEHLMLEQGSLNAGWPSALKKKKKKTLNRFQTVCYSLVSNSESGTSPILSFSLISAMAFTLDF